MFTILCYLTWHAYPSLVEGERHGILFINSSNIFSFILFADDTTVYVQNDSIDGAIKLLN